MWDLMFSDEQAMIADSVAQFLSKELPVERLRPKAAPVDADVIWRSMAELGWFGIGITEEAGGSGLGLVEEMLIQRGCGRHLASTSILATMVAAHVAQAAGDAALTRALVTGERRVALAIGLGSAGTDEFEALAFDWADGELLLYWDDTGAGLFEAGKLSSDAGLDDSLTLHRGRLSLAAAKCWVPNAQAPIALRANALLAACLAGLADGACALATDYAKLREQFGKPIGTFQAIKHRCADMIVRAEISGHLVALACLKVEAGATDASLQVAAAKLKSAHSAHENGRAVIQVHGGLGYQSECDAHWFMKRAHVYDQAGGNMQAQAERVFAEASPLW